MFLCADLGTPFIYFGKIVFINLDKRVDRLEESLTEFYKQGFTAERFRAFSGDNRHLAFNKSQYFAIKSVSGYANALVLEDDCVFINTSHLYYAVNELPPDWDIFYLGANLTGLDGLKDWKYPTEYSHHLCRLHDAFQTHAIAYSRKMMQWIVDNFPFYKDEYEREGLTIFDEWLRINVLHGDFKSFVINPQISYQRRSFSDLWNVESDYTSCFERGNKLME